MNDYVSAYDLERIVRAIREHERRLEGESIDEFMKRTWQVALKQYQDNQPILPRVKALQERSERIVEREKQLMKGTKQNDEDE